MKIYVKKKVCRIFHVTTETVCFSLLAETDLN